MPDNAEIASRLGDLYRFFIFIGYIRDDQIRWPPHSSETFNIDDCRATGYSEAALTLLQALPWPVGDQPEVVINLIHKSKAADDSDPWDVEGGRHPSLPDWDRGHEAVKLLPDQIITLSFGEYDDGLSVLLDADEGKIWEWFQDSRIFPSEGVDACEYLKNLLQRHKSLEEIPVNRDILFEDDDTLCRKKYKNSKQMLLDYGWPEAFRKDDFNRDIGAMQEQWEEEASEVRDREDDAEFAALHMEELAVTEAAERSQ